MKIRKNNSNYIEKTLIGFVSISILALFCMSVVVASMPSSALLNNLDDLQTQITVEMISEVDEEEIRIAKIEPLSSLKSLFKPVNVKRYVKIISGKEKYAKFVEDETGVRAELLLALLKQESNLGQNVGTGTWKKDMHVRDRKAFKQICKQLGLQPDETPVSKETDYGWGGAMGYAQILPNNWLKIEARVARITGNNPPSPWEFRDALVGAGIMLAELGADKKTNKAEIEATSRYFAGKRWQQKRFRWYSQQVLALAEKY